MNTEATLEQLLEALVERVVERTITRLAPHLANGDDAWITRKNVEQIYGSKLRVFVDASNRGELCRYRIGGTPAFKRTELDKWVEARRVEREPTPPMDLSLDARLERERAKHNPDEPMPRELADLEYEVIVRDYGARLDRRALAKAAKTRR